jgi:ribonucleoside-diphosphate reductase alpha chain
MNTGRIYIQNLDNANAQSPFKDKISMSNLCQEINLPTTEFSDINSEEGEIALCMLGINLGILAGVDTLKEWKTITLYGKGIR